jgi:hypothetical protein
MVSYGAKKGDQSLSLPGALCQQEFAKTAILDLNGAILGD